MPTWTAIRIAPVLMAATLALGGTEAARGELQLPGNQSFLPGFCCLVDAETDAYFARALARGDFNEDGLQDLAISAPGAEVAGELSAGKVVVLPGTATGLSPVGFAGFDDESLGGTAEEYEYFGGALAAGDWNGDGADDLAIGVPDDDTAAGSAAGSVWIVYGNDAQGGAPGALFGEEVDHFVMHVSLGGFPHAGDRFGGSLATGDFNGDGLDDLAIGVPYDNVYAGNFHAGSVSILLGSPSGLSPAGGNNFSRVNLSYPDLLQDSEEFASALAAGDFDGDGVDELAVGAPGRNGDTELWVGEVLVLEFDDDGVGVEVADHWVWSEGEGIPGAEEPSDRYGHALVTGDFSADGADDLVIGAPTESVGGDSQAGAIAYIPGAPGLGLQPNAILLTQDDVASQVVREGEAFGHALAAGDFDHNGADDLVIGAPGDLRLIGSPGDQEWRSVGAVHIVSGGTAGLAFGAAQTLVGTPGDDEAENFFGGSLVTGRFREGVTDALAVGSTGWDVFGFLDVGRLNVIYSGELFSDDFETGDTSRW